MVSRQDHGELMCWVSVDQALKQATRVKNSLCLSRQDHVDQVLKQATRVKNSLCLSRDYDGVLEEHVVTKMIFIVELDMVMEESLVI